MTDARYYGLIATIWLAALPGNGWINLVISGLAGAVMVIAALKKPSP